MISLLDANAELAGDGSRLTAGTLVGLPEEPVETVARTVVQLWGPGS